MTASAYTTFRQALTTTLSATLTGYTYLAGAPPQGGSAIPDSTPLAYVWVEKAETDTKNALLENITAGVRLYVVWSQRLDPQTPIDPGVLEQAAEDLQTTLAPGSYPGDPWYFTVQSIAFDNDNGYIEATVVGVRWNDGTVS